MARAGFRCALLIVFLVLSTSEARGVIEAPTGLRVFVADSALIVRVRIVEFYPEKPALVFEVEEDLKGKAGQRRLPVAVKLNPTAKDLEIEKDRLGARLQREVHVLARPA